MSFGGAVSGMITSLKNNKRSRSDTFKKMKNFEGVHYNEIHFDKKATPQQLEKIKAKIKKENRDLFLKRAIILGIFFLLIVYFIGFYKY